MIENTMQRTQPPSLPLLGLSEWPDLLVCSLVLLCDEFCQNDLQGLGYEQFDRALVMVSEPPIIKTHLRSWVLLSLNHVVHSLLQQTVLFLQNRYCSLLHHQIRIRRYSLHKGALKFNFPCDCLTFLFEMIYILNQAAQQSLMSSEVPLFNTIVLDWNLFAAFQMLNACKQLGSFLLSSQKLWLELLMKGFFFVKLKFNFGANHWIQIVARDTTSCSL